MKYPGLKERVVEYYTAQQKNDWEKAYAMHAPEFRKIKSKDEYTTSMSKYNIGWRLKEYEIESVKEIDGKVVLSMKFEREAPISHFLPEMSAKGLPPNIPPVKDLQTSKIVWIQSDGEWYFYTAVN